MKSRGPDTAGVDICCSDMSADGSCRGVIALILNPDDDKMQCWRMQNIRNPCNESE